MYDMYPDVWTVPEDRQPSSPGPRPRRRARREHSVVPAILGPGPTPPSSPGPELVEGPSVLAPDVRG